MAVLPTPVSTDLTNLYSYRMRFVFGIWQWVENWYAIVAGASTNPLADLAKQGAALASARKTFLASNASVYQVASIYLGRGLGHKKAFTTGDFGSGPGPGKGASTDIDVWEGWLVSFFDSTVSMGDRRFFRGLPANTNTWKDDAFYIPPAEITDGVKAMFNVLSQKGEVAGPFGGKVTFVIPSSRYNPNIMPATTPLVRCEIDSGGRLRFVFNGPINKGFLPTVTPIGVGDYFKFHGSRVKCLKGFMGTYRVLSVTVDEGAQTYTYQTDRVVCCNPAALAGVTGYGWAVQRAFYGYGYSEVEKVVKKKTGISGNAGTRGRKAPCCR